MRSEAAFSSQAAEQKLGYLTTTGRVSGLPREIEIWFALVPERRVVYLLSGGRDRSHWVRNLRHSSAARFRIGDTTVDVTARFIVDEAEDSVARNLLVAKYEGTPGSLARWRRESLPIALDY